MALYFRYRALAGEDYARRAFVGRARATGEMKDNDRAQLLKTQSDFLSTLRHAHDLARTDLRMPVAGRSLADTMLREWVFDLKVMPRRRLYADDRTAPSADPGQIRRALKDWRDQVMAREGTELLHPLPDLDYAAIIDALEPAGLPAAVSAFFDEYVHDSMASFIGMGMDEFDKGTVFGNALGLFKWRRLFFGDREDAFAREQVSAINKKRRADAARQRDEQARARAQQAQWRLEAEAFARTRSR
jgi:hypothetical protein